MIDIECSCGARFQVLNERVAEQVKCPGCGMLASDLIAVAEVMDAPPDAPSPDFVVPCGNHPDQRATHNCLNCGKPLCMQCVEKRGYFCSDACHEAVQAQEPASPKTVGVDLTVLDKTLATTGVLAKQLLKVALIIGVLYGGWVAYRSYFGARGKISATMPAASSVRTFKAEALDEDQAVVQNYNELFLASLSNQKKLWSVKLDGLEEKVALPGPDGKLTEEAYETTSEGDRYLKTDPLHLNYVTRDVALALSGRQIVAFKIKDGSIQWKYFARGKFVQPIVLHNGQLLCSVTTEYDPAAMAGPAETQLVNFQLRDGAMTVASANVPGYAHQIWQDKQIVQLEMERPAAAKRRKPDTADPSDLPNEDEVPSAGIVKPPNAKELLGMATGKIKPRALPAANYTLKLIPLDGGPAAEKSFALSGRAEVHFVGTLLCIGSDRALLVFDNGVTPRWQASVESAPSELAGGGNTLAAHIGENVVAFDAKSGQLKWTRTGLHVGHIAVSPDGEVYVEATYSKAEANSGEAEKFRIASLNNADILERRALLKLDANSGKTDWGVRNIGEQIEFIGDALYVIDRHAKMDLLGNSVGGVAGLYSIRCVSPSNGKDRWAFVKQGDLYNHAVVGKKVFCVVADEPPAGRLDPKCAYQLQLVEAK